MTSPGARGGASRPAAPHAGNRFGEAAFAWPGITLGALVLLYADIEEAQRALLAGLNEQEGVARTEQGRPRIGRGLSRDTDTGSGGRIDRPEYGHGRNDSIGRPFGQRKTPPSMASSAKYIESRGGAVVRSYMRPRYSPGATCRISSRLPA